MTITKTHIAIGFTITFIIGLILLFIYLWQRRQSKTLDQIQMKIQVNTKPNSTTGMVISGQPEIYGNQKVYRDSEGRWRILPGTCTLTQPGIIDWEAIKNMPQIEKDQLYLDIDKCKLTNLPLIQP